MLVEQRQMLKNFSKVADGSYVVKGSRDGKKVRGIKYSLLTKQRIKRSARSERTKT